jgi:predicted N-acetyltransferase YhbS
MARVVSDRVYVSTLQQVGVHPDYQRQGLGNELVRRCMERFDHTQFLLTIDDESNVTFYSRFGFTKTADAMIRLRNRNPSP